MKHVPLHVTAHRLNISPALQKFLERKIGALSRFAGDMVGAEIVLRGRGRRGTPVFRHCPARASRSRCAREGDWLKSLPSHQPGRDAPGSADPETKDPAGQNVSARRSQPDEEGSGREPDPFRDRLLEYRGQSCVPNEQRRSHEYEKITYYHERNRSPGVERDDRRRWPVERAEPG